MQGLLDTASICWEQTIYSHTPKGNMFEYNKDVKSRGGDRVQKIYCDLSRICEVEDAVVEWYDIKYF